MGERFLSRTNAKIGCVEVLHAIWTGRPHPSFHRCTRQRAIDFVRHPGEMEAEQFVVDFCVSRISPREGVVWCLALSPREAILAGVLPNFTGDGQTLLILCPVRFTRSAVDGSRSQMDCIIRPCWLDCARTPTCDRRL